MAEMIPFGKSEGESRPSTQGEARQDVRSYSNEEVSEIIRVALRNAEESRTSTVGYEEMLTIARDFGLTPGDISRAFDEINLKRDAELTDSKARLSLKIHGVVFAVVMAGLFAINGLSMPDYWWALYPFIVWGTVFVLHAVLVRYIPQIFGQIVWSAEAKSREPGDMQLSTPGAEATARFTCPELFHGLAQCSGLLQLTNDELLIEFETKDTVLNLWRSGMREVRVPIADIASVRLERQFWNSRVILRSHRLKSFEGIPGHDAGQVKLILDKNSRAAGERLVRELSDRVARSR